MLNLCRNSLFLCLGSYAILSRIIDAMQILFCENLNSTKLRMKHLGGKVVWNRGKWLLRPISMVPGVRALVNGHPGTEEYEELRVTIASSAAIVIWAMA